MTNLVNRTESIVLTFIEEGLETSFSAEPDGSPEGKAAEAPYEPEEFPDEIFDDFLDMVR